MKKILKWTKRIILTLMGILFVAYIILSIRFYFWEKNVLANLPQDTQIAETTLGPIEYKIIGDRDNYIFFVHGTPGSVHPVTQKSIQHYLDKGYAYILISRPGYFNTPLSSGKTPQQQADLYASLLDELQIDRVHMLGLSGGGPSATEFAIRHPQRTASLILQAALTKSEAPPESSLLEQLFMKSDVFIWAYYQLLLESLDDPETKEKAERTLQTAVFPLEKSKPGTDNDYTQFTKDLNPELEMIKAPTILFHGDRDMNVSYQSAVEASERIPNAELITFTGRGHFNILKPSDTEELERLYNFLDNHSQP